MPILWILVAGFLLLGIQGCASQTAQTTDAPSGAPIAESHVSSSLSEEPNVQQTEKASPDDIDFDPFAEADTEEIEEYDPWEPFNVLMFKFNYNFDKYFLKHVAKGYNYVVPDDLQQSIYNAFQNLGFTPRFLNNIFQGKFKGASIEASRFVINTTLGVGGLFDPATALFGLETPLEDFGQTLATYGTPSGPYLVSPFLGPFTLRDAFGYTIDIFLNPINWFVFPIIKTDVIPQLVTNDLDIALAQLGLRSFNILNTRSINLERFEEVEEGTLDLYGAVRNAYLQNRIKAIQE